MVEPVRQFSSVATPFVQCIRFTAAADAVGVQKYFVFFSSGGFFGETHGSVRWKPLLLGVSR